MPIKVKKLFWGLISVFSFWVMLFWMVGFFGGFVQLNRLERYDTPKSLNGIKNIAVDSHGNIYYGNEELGIVQVYDNLGNFLYGFSFIKGVNPYFAFYIDDTDHVNLISQGGHGVYTFEEGKLINLREFVDRENRISVMEDFELRQSNEFYDEAGIRYKVIGNKVEMHNETGQHIRTIKPNAPIWPFPIMVNGALMIASFVMIFIAAFKCVNTSRATENPSRN